jgi:hypothetical protein
MSGVDLAYPQAATAVDSPMERLEALLSRHHLRVATGRSRWTGQAVIRLVDERTGLPQARGVGAFSDILAGLVHELAAAGTRQK